AVLHREVLGGHLQCVGVGFDPSLPSMRLHRGEVGDRDYGQDTDDHDYDRELDEREAFFAQHRRISNGRVACRTTRGGSSAPRREESKQGSDYDPLVNVMMTVVPSLPSAVIW